MYLEDGVLPKIITIDGIHLKEEAYKTWYEVLKVNVRNTWL